MIILINIWECYKRDNSGLIIIWKLLCIVYKCAKLVKTIFVIMIWECPFITNKNNHNDNDNSNDSEIRDLDNSIHKGVRGHCFIKTSTNLISMGAEHAAKTISESNYGIHCLLIYSDLTILRKFYSSYISTQILDKEEVVQILPFYETEDSVCLWSIKDW